MRCTQGEYDGAVPRPGGYRDPRARSAGGGRPRPSAGRACGAVDRREPGDLGRRVRRPGLGAGEPAGGPAWRVAHLPLARASGPDGDRRRRRRGTRAPGSGVQAGGRRAAGGHAPLRRTARAGQGRGGGRPGRGTDRRGSGTVATRTVRGAGHAVDQRHPPKPRIAAAGGPAGADRHPAAPRPARRTAGRADRRGRPVSPGRAHRGPADARPVPRRAAGRRPRALPPGSPAARRRTRRRSRAGAQRAAPADPDRRRGPDRHRRQPAAGAPAPTAGRPACSPAGPASWPG